MNDKVVLTIGTFDIPHLGHYSFLQKVHNLFPNHKLVVAVNTDDFIKRFKGKPPVCDLSTRMTLISKIDFVDQIIVNEGDEDSTRTITMVNNEIGWVDIIAIGSDWAKKDYYKQMSFTQDWLDLMSISLIYIPYTKGLSTTLIKEKL